MAMNNVQLQGRVAFVNYKEGTGDKKSFISFAISYNTGRKENEGDQYNKEDLFRCKAFGPTADFIHKNFPEKSQILIDGTLSIGNDYTKDDGSLVKGGVEINVRGVHFCGFKENNNHQGETTNSTPQPTPAPQPRPSVKPTVAPKPVVKPIVPRR